MLLFRSFIWSNEATVSNECVSVLLHAAMKFGKSNSESLNQHPKEENNSDEEKRDEIVFNFIHCLKQNTNDENRKRKRKSKTRERRINDHFATILFFFLDTKIFNVLPVVFCKTIGCCCCSFSLIPCKSCEFGWCLYFSYRFGLWK